MSIINDTGKVVEGFTSRARSPDGRECFPGNNAKQSKDCKIKVSGTGEAPGMRTVVKKRSCWFVRVKEWIP